MSTTQNPNSTASYADLAPSSVGPITWDDATWIITSSFIIFTMQSGFGLLEAGCVSRRNEVNIMFKNAIDVVFGGLSYWAFGFGLSFGDKEGSNPFFGVGYFLVDETDTEIMGILYSTYVFQLSFATTATTIVSGPMAERTKLLSYIIFSFFNTLVYCLPAHWEWANNGFLKVLGVVDIAGSGAVHLVGGVSALVAAIMLKPRMGRFRPGVHPSINPIPMGNPASCLMGMFMLWWGWLAFNCGSTFGISGGKWKLAAKSAVTTLNGSMGGGAIGIVLSFILNKRKYDIGFLVNSVLGALVAITGHFLYSIAPEWVLLNGSTNNTLSSLNMMNVYGIAVVTYYCIAKGAGCMVIRPWEALLIGGIGSMVSVFGNKLVELARVDDPVSAVAVHGISGIWGMLAVGLFAENETIEGVTQGRSGLFHGGGFYLLGVQTLACVTIIAWSAIATTAILFLLKVTIGLRLSEEDEIKGADYVEHMIGVEIVFDVDKNDPPYSNTTDDDVIHGVTVISMNADVVIPKRSNTVAPITQRQQSVASLQSIDSTYSDHPDIKRLVRGNDDKTDVSAA